MTDQTEKPNRPVHEIRLRNVVAAIWANPTEDGRTFYAVTPYRVYQAQDGWHRTTSFDRDDVPLLSWVANKAFDYIAEMEAAPPAPTNGAQSSAADSKAANRPARSGRRSGQPVSPG